MDITSDYGSLVRGSNPRGRAIQKSPRSRLNTSFAGFLLFFPSEDTRRERRGRLRFRSDLNVQFSLEMRRERFSFIGI